MSTEKRRPWWAAALLGGAMAGVTITKLWNYATPVKPAIAAEMDNDRLARIETKVDNIIERVAHIEGRLEVHSEIDASGSVQQLPARSRR